MKIVRINFILLAVLILFTSSCSSKSMPAFYPNSHYERVGSVQADVDRKECMALADNYVERKSEFNDMAKDATVGSLTGAAGGALTGVIVNGSVGRATAAGAAVGAIVNIVRDIANAGRNTDPTYRTFVSHCLEKKGYQVVGWGGK